MTGLARSPGSPRAAERSLRRAGDALRRRIWDPVSQVPLDASRVLVVPDGTLNLVPLAALPIGQTDYLLEKGPILHYLSAERDLVSTGEASSVGKGLLALGGPSFDDGALFTALAKPASPRRPISGQSRPQATAPVADESSLPLGASASFRGLNSSCPTFQSLRFDALPASRWEANEVASLWKELGHDSSAVAGARVLVGRDADERTFKRLSAGRRILHLATHGFFLGTTCASALNGTRNVGGLTPRKKPQPGLQKTVNAAGGTAFQSSAASAENPLLLSGLAMAGANRRAAASAEEDDGILTAEEIGGLNLQGTEWAVLSACDTGLGEIKAGEGVFGLRRAFQVAGARTVIMSLWSVEDRSAMQWMRALYVVRGRPLRHAVDARPVPRDACVEGSIRLTPFERRA